MLLNSQGEVCMTIFSLAVLHFSSCFVYTLCIFMKFDIFMVVTDKIALFWGEITCSLVEVYTCQINLHSSIHLSQALPELCPGYTLPCLHTRFLHMTYLTALMMVAPCSFDMSANLPQTLFTIEIIYCRKNGDNHNGSQGNILHMSVIECLMVVYTSGRSTEN